MQRPEEPKVGIAQTCEHKQKHIAQEKEIVYGMKLSKHNPNTINLTLNILSNYNNE